MLRGVVLARLLCLIGCFSFGIPAVVLFYLASKGMAGRVATVIRLVTLGLFLMILDAVIRDIRVVFGGLYVVSIIVYFEVAIHTIGEVLFLIGGWILYRSLELIRASEGSLASAKAESEERLLFGLDQPSFSSLVGLEKFYYKLGLWLKEKGWVAQPQA